MACRQPSCSVVRRPLWWIVVALWLSNPTTASAPRYRGQLDTSSAREQYGGLRKLMADTSPTYASPSANEMLNSISVAQRNTTDGSKCRLPVFSGVLLTDCFQDPGTTLPSSVCYTQGLNTTAPCSDSSFSTSMQQVIANGTFLDGQEGALCLLATSQPMCTLPLECTASQTAPLTGTDVGYCATPTRSNSSSAASGASQTPSAPAPAPASSGAVVTPASIPGVAVNHSLPAGNTSQILVQGRITFSGEQCRLPMVYQGQLLTDCLATPDGDQCFPVGSTSLRNCSASRKTNHTLAAILLAGSTNALDGQLGSICSTDIVSVSGGPTPCLKGSYCRELLNGTLANTGLGFCAASPVTNSSSPSPFAGYKVATRNDAQYNPCRLPLVYQGTLFLDCVPLGNSSAPACFIDDNLAGKPAACEPATADAAAPLQTVLVTPVGTDGLAGSLCQLQESDIGDLSTTSCSSGLQCTPLVGPFTDSNYGFCEPAASLPAPAPAPAALPAAPVPSPAVSSPAVASPAAGPQQPASLLEVPVLARNTTNGTDCGLPMVVHGDLLTSCVSNGTADVCFPDGQTAQPCAAQPKESSQTISGLLQAGTLSQGKAGQLCSLTPMPSGQSLFCQGSLACMGAVSGLLAASAYGYCSPLQSLMGQQQVSALESVAVTARTTVSGKACSLPLVVGGLLLTDCTNGTCWVASGGQEACASTAASDSSSGDVSVATAMAAEVGLQGQTGSLCSVEARRGLGCAASLTCTSFDGSAQGSSSEAVAGAGVGFCAKAQASRATVNDEGPGCGAGCIAGVALACVALIAAFGLLGLLAYKGKRRHEDYGRFRDQPLSTARNFTSTEAETPHTGTHLAQGRPSFSGKQFDSIELGAVDRPAGSPFRG